MGVNTYETERINLLFPANDVLGLTTTLSEALRKVGNYAEVIPISLISNRTSRQATKGNLKTVLNLLAGKQPDAQMLANIPGAEKLRRATPDDLVIVYLSPDMVTLIKPERSIFYRRILAKFQDRKLGMRSQSGLFRVMSLLYGFETSTLVTAH